MTDLEFFLQLVYARSKAAAKTVAIAVDETYKIVGLAEGGASPCETAIANLLHGLKRRLDGYWVFASYPPTPLCLGMSNIVGIGSVGFIEGEKFKDASQTQQIVALSPFPSTAIALFARGNPSLPDWKTSAAQYLAALKTNQAAMNPSYQTAMTSLDRCVAFTNRDLDATLQGIFSQLPASPPAGAMTTRERDHVYMHLVFGLVGQTWNPVLVWDVKNASGERFGGNNVGAVIVHQGAIIGWGLNMASQNPTYHAETLAILSYLKAGHASLPDGCTIYTSLEPCKMCAGMIVAAGANIDVVMGARDHLISTVISNGKKYNGCSTHMPDVAPPPEGRTKLFGDVEAAIENRRRDAVDDARYDLSSDGGGGASTKFLRDDPDLAYRNAHADYQKNVLSPQSALRLAKLKADFAVWDRNPGAVKKQKPFQWAKELETLKTKEATARKSLETMSVKEGTGFMGKKFAGYLDTLAKRWKVLKAQPDSAERRAYEQAIGLLRIVAVEGLSTNYGVNFVEALFSDFA